ncbi:hypothetical protein JNK13_00285 [bacterium]|nr:hypothetical protein [bacterium]
MNQQQQNPLLIQRIIWGALFFSIFIYALALNLAATGGGGKDISELSSIFPAIATVLAALSLTIKSIVSKPFAAAAQANPNFNSNLVTMIIRLALADSVAVLGFVLGFLAKQPEVAYPYFTAAGVLMIFAWPKE